MGLRRAAVTVLILGGESVAWQTLDLQSCMNYNQSTHKLTEVKVGTARDPNLQNILNSRSEECKIR